MRLAIDKSWKWSEEEEARRNCDRDMGICAKGDAEKRELMVKGGLPILELNIKSPDM